MGQVYLCVKRFHQTGDISIHLRADLKCGKRMPPHNTQCFFTENTEIENLKQGKPFKKLGSL